jgi:hypothetical protein
MPDAPIDPYVQWLLELAPVAATVANYCDHIEHNEKGDPGSIGESGLALRMLALEMAARRGEKIRDLYAARLKEIETRNPLSGPGKLDGAELASNASTWRDLQMVQIEHDRHYHPDVLGLSKLDQLRHCAFHLAKLVGAVADVASQRASEDDLYARRVPDLSIFGLKLATLSGEKLREDTLREAQDSLKLLAG